jgi:hypothetical protein
VGAQSDDGAVYGSATTGIVPVLGPVLLDGAARLADVLEVGAAEVLVLLDVEPEVENVFCAFTLEKETDESDQKEGGEERRGDALEHE